MARIADHSIEQMFLDRWSSRAMTGEAISVEDLLRLFEAARWAPSCANSQPWRFLCARAGTEHFPRFFDLLEDGNKSWCVRAGALLVILSKKTFENGKPSPTHSFDTGAAWMSLALQGLSQGLVVHGMAGSTTPERPVNSACQTAIRWKRWWQSGIREKWKSW